MDEKEGTVLVIDDSPASAYQLFGVLGDTYHVLVATRGSEGIDLAVAQAPDLILLDVVMPELSGYEVCTRLKKDARTQNIPIIFVTARDDADDEEHGLSLGAIDYLTKPLRPAIVRARVKNHIELKHNRDLLQRLTLLDPLTGIANRRRFDEYLQAESRRAAHTGHAMTLLMIDVDYFKGYNDHYGHALGDQCLTRVAAAIQSGLRQPGDLVARYGGEEFACILPDTELDDALRIAERIRGAVEGMAIAHVASSVAPCITVSLGVASGDRATLVETADAALYQAKRQGRNRLVIAPQPACTTDHTNTEENKYAL